MRKIYLPNLKTIRIQNYSLYPKGLDFEYSFINGVNLIMGGNGMGKTTFVNIIKYSVIGHYKEGYAFTRTYLGKKIEKRRTYALDYFKNRIDRTSNTVLKPNVTIEFEINKKYFVVSRNLEDIILKSVYVNNRKLEGKLIRDDRYEQLNINEKKQYLNFNYEEEISKASKITYDDLIFFVNEVLFFGENHKTILWDDEEPNVQEQLFNKYFNEPELDLERQEAYQQAKYYNSLARHKSEDIRAISNVLTKINKENEETSENSISSQIIFLREEIEKLDKTIDERHKERSKADDKIRQLNDDLNKLSQSLYELEKNKKVAEYKKLGGTWLQLHPQYNNYLQNIKVNEKCPMCNQNLEKDFVEDKLINSNCCFLCDQKIVKINSRELDKKFNDLTKEHLETGNKIKSTQNLINDEDKRIRLLDIDFRELTSNKRELQSKLRRLEHKSQDSDIGENELQAFYDEIEQLQKEKEELLEQSKKEKAKAEKITGKIEQHIRENTLKFSALFAEFAEKFLGVKCSLTFTNQSQNEGKRLYPVINGTIRYTEEEMSESQRFFVDHSFRMSILSFFHQSPTFYIVETPNSSLDISYEKNAANVFAKFLEKPNSLIITTNLNNSEFLQHLVETANNVGFIDLLEIGKQSDIQNANQIMKSISENIKNKVWKIET